MTGWGNVGLLKFKRKTKSLHFDEQLSDEEDIAEMKESINYIVLWLCELEEMKKQ